tara:strand:- start:562 stop:1572 length:1011 start_codon:yes stop_codon:yes gene_type:complete
MSELNSLALKILSNGKGILAADESTGTMTKRLNAINVESTPENRLLFRETLFSSEGMKTFIGGVILYDETIKQTTSSKKSIPELISDSGAVPGIKVDTGAKVLANSPEEKITEGLDGLRERLKLYYKLGARFTKWRGVYSITKKFPSKLSIHSNAHALARYSAIVQECKMVPIVEPEVLMDGNHAAEECLNKTSEVIKKCFEELELHEVDLSGIILKPNMILAGSSADKKISNEEIAKLTLKCLKETVPKEVPGVAFLSGGQTEKEATKNLNLINKFNDTNFIMTYSYGRALQQSALKFWSNDIQNIKGTQDVFNHRAKMCSLAAQGKWLEELESK